jgi:hypothetical protein
MLKYTNLALMPLTTLYIFTREELYIQVRDCFFVKIGLNLYDVFGLFTDG